MKRKHLVLGVIILIVLITAGVYVRNQQGIEAETVEVRRGRVAEYVEETAVIKSIDQRIVYTQAMGAIQKVNVDEGDKVAKGQVLAVLDTQKNALQIKQLEAQLEGLKAAYRETLKGADQEKIKQAEANVRSLEIKVEQARKTAQDYKKLYEEEAISEETYRNSLNNLALQEEALKIAQNELALLKKGASEATIKQQQADIKQLEYQIEMLKKDRGNLFIKCPEESVVLEVKIKEGSFVQPGTPLFELGDPQDLYAQADILVEDIAQISEGDDVILFGEDLNVEMKGKVKKIHPKAFSKVSDLGIEQKRVRVEIDLANQTADLRIGYDLTARIITQAKSNVLMIPKSAVFSIGQVKHVFVVENSKAVLSKIQTGMEGEDNFEIVSGLKEGDTIILYPDEEIQEGTRIKPVKP